ncbi:flagellar biosynthesis protein FlhB [Helicobacter monodelphidis]|uniref:EscU/YscU/HrcU family type III secretion system export apparatus switch protein n=1 Tax=Helicobacter sp. 15-1451 TaxID=2004995 RepID=UPI000DCE442C|nr:EscU/YscU/HrcU family type III secretion system export apparatus switch protein [Helicobacter sp. 15-1451]RAX58166.1 flagellar biosynthesis protein FlhB [Helicobacter sp. 15-1451]
MNHAKAAALAYNRETDRAPKLVAKGKGHIADKIIEKAKEFDVPLFQNEMLVDSLLKAEVDAEIPQALYQAVVEVFVWLYESEQKAQMSR